MVANNSRIDAWIDPTKEGFKIGRNDIWHQLSFCRFELFFGWFVERRCRHGYITNFLLHRHRLRDHHQTGWNAWARIRDAALMAWTSLLGSARAA